jgi:hypothetical protein
LRLNHLDISKDNGCSSKTHDPALVAVSHQRAGDARTAPR